MKPPAFQFYADDFMAGTSILSTEEVGAYILLLCHQWSCGGVPDDDKLIRRIARITQAFDLALVRAKFELVDGVLKNRRLEDERAKQVAYREKQAENGAKGGRPTNPSLTQALAKHKPKDNPNESSPSPSPSPSPVSDSEPIGNSVASLPRIQKPSLETIKLQAAKIGLPDQEAEKFFNYYESNGWRVGRNPMKSWVHALTNWKNNASNYGTNSKSNTQPIQAVRGSSPVGGF